MRFVTNGEVLTLAAMILDLESTDIDSFVLIIRGECPYCPNRDAISVAGTSGSSRKEMMTLIVDGMTTLLVEGE